MKARLAKKIMTINLLFKGFVSNYQPYNIEQQKKALKVAGRIYSKVTRESMYRNIPVPKVPVRYRKRKGFLPNEFDCL